MENSQELIDSVIGFESIYESERKCEHGVMKKGGVQAFSLNRLKNSIKLSDSLYNNTYKAKPTKEIKITYPKPRLAYANAFEDRVYQRSLNDNQIYPQMSKQFIKENMACQKGKGTDKARKMFKQMLHYMWLQHGTNFYILQCDIKKYYDNMTHEYTDEILQKNLDEWTFKKTVEVLHNQYSDEKGYHPGSQMVQIAGISYLSSIDHYIKEQLHIKKYVRYMDDLILLHEDQDYLISCKEILNKKLQSIGLQFHETKTKITKPTAGVLFLGFVFRIASDNKIIMTCDPKKVKANKKKLYRMVTKAKQGKITKEDCDNSFQCIIAHLSKGNSYNLILRMKKLYNDLWENN